MYVSISALSLVSTLFGLTWDKSITLASCWAKPSARYSVLPSLPPFVPAKPRVLK